MNHDAPAMPDDRAQAAAEVLLGHLHDGTKLAALPAALRPRTREDGYAIQAHWLRATRAPLFGWKIAATSAAGQAHINVDAPLAGRLLAERVLPDGATASIAHSAMRVVEVEFAFRFAMDLTPRARDYSVDEVLAAVATLHPALEIPDSRYEDFCAVGAPQLIADNACADRFILGAATPRSWRDADLASVEVEATVNGSARHAGRGSNALGDPRIALAWLVNELSRLGVTLRAGEVVTTGTCVTPVPVVPGDALRAEYGSFGSLTVRLC